MNELNKLYEDFNLACYDQDEDVQKACFKALVEGYEAHFGDLWQDVLTVLLDHSDAELIDWLS